MKILNTILGKLAGHAKEALGISTARRRILFTFMSAALFVTSFVMTIVNVVTAEYILMTATLAFSIACLINMALIRLLKIEKVIYCLFGVEALCLLTFFVVSGIPDGFSVLWCVLIPSFALLIFGIQNGGIFSGLVFILLVFMFWTPIGQSLLQYEYSKTFMLRFPFYYVASFMLSLIIEFLRAETQNLAENEAEKYDFLHKHDLLTGLYNRYGIDEFIKESFTGKDGESASVIMFDIDNFKVINDEYGHTVGDEVLKTISKIPNKILCENCRSCRWGGEEFLLILRCKHDAIRVAEKLRTEIEQATTEYQNKEIHVTASFGVCTADNLKGIDIYDLVTMADNAMYMAKEKGRNRVEVCTSDKEIKKEVESCAKI